MAARNFAGEIQSLDRHLKVLFGVVTFGVAEITSQASNGFTVTRTGVGLYTLTLEDKYSDLLGMPVQYFSAAPNATDSCNLKIVTETVATTKLITFQLWDTDSPAATDPATTDKLFIQVWLRASGGPRKGS